MKLIIADDEKLIRISLTSMINEIESSWQIAGEATNGEEALDLLREHMPNIAIVDIRMPGMNGLEVIRQGKLISPHTKWLILSGFSEFTYAQEALKLGASEYLLKPVQPAELERALCHMYQDNKELVYLLNQQFENSLFTLCNGLMSVHQEERESLFYKGCFTGVTILIDTVKSEKETAEIYQRLYEELHTCMNNHLTYGMNLAIISLLNSELAAIGVWDPAADGKVKDQVYSFFTQLQLAADRFSCEEVKVSILWTDENKGFGAMNEKLLQLQQWSSLRALCGIGRPIPYRELLHEAEVEGQLALGRLLVSFQQHIQDRMYLKYQNTVNELEGLLGKTGLLESGSKQKAVSLFIRSTVGADIAEHANTAQTILALNRYGEQFLRELKPREQASADVIEQVISYIEKHYMNDIGIKHIADQLNLSANYLSTLFHRKTGVMFLKYLTRIRMNKAKELLLNTNLHIKQIGEEVGYYSTRHFTKLFTETFSSYPSDFRKVHSQINNYG